MCVSEASATTTEMSLVFGCTMTIKWILILESKLPSHFHDYHPSFPFFNFSFFHYLFLTCLSRHFPPLFLIINSPTVSPFLPFLCNFFFLLSWSCGAQRWEKNCIFPLWCSWVLVTQSCLWITEFPSSSLCNGPIQCVFFSKKKRSTKGS